MTTRPAVSRFAVLLLLAGCGDEPPAPTLVPPTPQQVTPEPAPEPVVAPAAAAEYSLHEWGLFGVEVGGTHAVVGGHVAHAPASAASASVSESESRAAERAQRNILRLLDEAAASPSLLREPHGLQHDGLSPAATGKPVIYLHVPSGAPPVEVAVALRLPPSQLLEHWPATTTTDDGLAWSVRATHGPCASPAAPPSATDAACQSVRDGFCEAAEIPRYHGQNDTCMTVGGVEVPLLFYRGDGADVSAMPLTLRGWLAGDTPETWEVTRHGEPPEGPVLFVEREGRVSRIHALRGPDFLMPGPDDAGITPADARSLLRDEALRRGLVAEEAEAFVDAWAPAYFGEPTREGPGAVGNAPASLAEADRALLYFAPESVVDAVLPLDLAPPPTTRHRVFLVRYVDTGGARETTDDTSAATPEAEARVRFGQPAIRGSLEPTLVRRVAQAHQAELLTCYQQALARTPEATGSVTVQYVITPPGTVGTATASDNDTGDGALGACIAQAVRRWTHPVSEGITAVRYSFQLTPHE